MMKKGKVLFIDTTHSELVLRLEKQGFECDYFEGFQRSDFMEVAADYIGIIIRSKIKLDREFLEKCTKLRFIGRVGAGMENIDHEYAESKGIACINAPEGNRDAVAEQAIGMLLTLFNNLLRADSEVRKRIWIREGNRGFEIGGKTIGIIGYGNTGMAMARKLSGFDARILAYDKYKNDFSDDYVIESDMETLYKKCDIISFHIPLTEETKFMINAEYINRFKKDIYLINTSRGKVLRTHDLVMMLDSGKILGACLDVLEYEGLSFETIDLPQEFDRLISKTNVVLTPHIAGWTHESNYKMATTITDKVAKLNL